MAYEFEKHVVIMSIHWWQTSKQVHGVPVHDGGDLDTEVRGRTRQCGRSQLAFHQQASCVHGC